MKKFIECAEKKGMYLNPFEVAVHPSEFSNLIGKLNSKNYDAVVKIEYNGRCVYRKLIGDHNVPSGDIVMPYRTLAELDINYNKVKQTPDEVTITPSNWFMYNLHNSDKKERMLFIITIVTTIDVILNIVSKFI